MVSVQIPHSLIPRPEFSALGVCICICQSEKGLGLGLGDVIHQELRITGLGILGVDFLQQHSLVLNFGTMPVSITSAAVTPRNENLAVVALPSENPQNPAVMPQEKSPPYLETLQPILQEENKNRSKFCAAAIVMNPSDMVEDCLIPSFGGPVAYDFPECKNDSYRSLLEEYKGVFQTTPGKATGVYHCIPTSGSPAKVPPRCVPAHY